MFNNFQPRFLVASLKVNFFLMTLEYRKGLIIRNYYRRMDWACRALSVLAVIFLIFFPVQLFTEFFGENESTIGTVILIASPCLALLCSGVEIIVLNKVREMGYRFFGNKLRR